MRTRAVHHMSVHATRVSVSDAQGSPALRLAKNHDSFAADAHGSTSRFLDTLETDLCAEIVDPWQCYARRVPGFFHGEGDR